ncbi:MAG TPA: phosphodiester glycosidase family protein [Sphingobacterium sp.]|nr:phosphodiester glycosidase family protein [Sphingobacterium sp.]
MHNKRIYVLIVFFLFITSASFAQSLDSIAVASKQWNTKEIAKGLLWKQAHFDTLFDSEQEINFLEIDLKKYRKRLRLAAEPRQLKKTSEMALAHQALVAVNGGFFDTKNGGAVDFIQVDGKVVNTSKRKIDRTNALFLFSRKKIAIALSTDTTYERERYPNVMLAGPLLLQDHRPYPLTKNAFNENRHPRTAIGVTADNKLLVLVVDGRHRMAHGMSLCELTDVLRWLGAKDAMNLDGGGSSSLYVRGATATGIVNHPSDNKQFDHEGERAVANIIYIK